jgi:hypothetical protein
MLSRYDTKKYEFPSVLKHNIQAKREGERGSTGDEKGGGRGEGRLAEVVLLDRIRKSTVMIDEVGVMNLMEIGR